MNLDELKQGLLAILSDRHEWIPVELRRPPMFENVIVLGTLSADSNRGIHEARRWTGWTSGPGRDETWDAPENQKGWEWLTPGDRHVKDVTHWFPKPLMPEVAHCVRMYCTAPAREDSNYCEAHAPENQPRKSRP